MRTFHREITVSLAGKLSSASEKVLETIIGQVTIFQLTTTFHLKLLIARLNLILPLRARSLVRWLAVGTMAITGKERSSRVEMLRKEKQLQ